MDIMTSFHKKEENVPEWFWQDFTKRRKMSHCHVDKILKKEENVPLSFWQVFTKRRKMSHWHSCKICQKEGGQKGGKCPSVILIGFPKKEENVPLSFWQVFTKRRKMSHHHSDKFSQKGGKCPTVILFPFYQVLDMGGKFSWNMGDLNPRQIKSQEY